MVRGIVAALIGLAPATLGVGCSEPAAPRAGPPVAERQAPVAPPPLYRAIELGPTGSVAGTVRFTGEPPVLAPLVVGERRDACGQEQPSPVLRIGPRGGVAGAVVTLVGVRAGKAVEPATVRFDRAGCRFEPHVAVATLGDTIRFGSRDAVLHNVRGTLDGERWIDVGLARAGDEASAAADRAGVVRLVCDAGHGWELAWLHVAAHPYATVTDEQGRFQIADVPAGTYPLRVWHEGWRPIGRAAGRPRYSAPVVLSRALSVIERQETTLDFELSEQAAEAAGE